MPAMERKKIHRKCNLLELAKQSFPIFESIVLLPIYFILSPPAFPVLSPCLSQPLSFSLPLPRAHPYFSPLDILGLLIIFAVFRIL
jgi:hypothetical protein